MNLTHIRRSITAARHTNRPLRYLTLNGTIATHLQAGRLIRVSTYLANRHLDPEFIDRYGSPAGRAVAKAYRTAIGAEPLRCWIRNDRGRWIHVMVYRPDDAALPTGFLAYKRTREYAATLALAA